MITILAAELKIGEKRAMHCNALLKRRECSEVASLTAKFLATAANSTSFTFNVPQPRYNVPINNKTRIFSNVPGSVTAHQLTCDCAKQEHTNKRTENHSKFPNFKLDWQVGNFTAQLKAHCC
jgi:hypothetical protein